MRPALVLLYVIVALLAVALVTLWIEQGRGTTAATTEGQVQAGEARATGPRAEHALDSASADADVQRRFDDLAKRLDAMAIDVDQLKQSAGRSPALVPPPTEAEFLDRHRSSVLQIVDEEQWKRDWEKTDRVVRQMATGLVERIGLPESARAQLDEFGGEYTRRVKALLEVAKAVPVDERRNDPSEKARSAKAWNDLHEWGKARLHEIGGVKGEDLWMVWGGWGDQVFEQYMR